MKDHEQIFINTIEDLHEWLNQHHENNESYWLVRYKKKYTDSYISYDELVDELICWGWVDSLPRSLSEEKTMIRISPRNPKSNWSKVNKDRVERLTNAKRMKNSGLALVDIAKKNGTWDFLNDVEQLIIPLDLQKALSQFPKALYYFERFPPSSKRGILEWIKNAKREETRNKRINDTAEKASRNLKANHPKGRDAGPKE